MKEIKNSNENKIANIKDAVIIPECVDAIGQYDNDSNDPVEELQDFMSNLDDEKNDLENRSYELDREAGTVDFAIRVYHNGRHHVKKDPETYIRFSKIAFDNICEFLSVRYPRLSDTERESIDNKLNGFLYTMSMEFHAFVKSYYKEWQKNYPWVFGDYQNVKENGAKSFFIDSDVWGTYNFQNKGTNRDIGKYPAVYMAIRKTPGTFNIKNLHFLAEMFPTYMVMSGKSDERIKMPLVEPDFELAEWCCCHTNDIVDKVMSSYRTFNHLEEHVIPSLIRAIPDSVIDHVGQGSNEALTINYSSNYLRYSAAIVWTGFERNFTDSASIVDLELKGGSIPPFITSEIIHIPYPEILSIDQFLESIPRMIDYLKEKDASHLNVDDEKFKEIIQGVRMKGHQVKDDHSHYMIEWFDKMIRNFGSSEYKGFLFETPGIPPEFLFKLLENRQYKKIRTVFISIYRIGKNSYLINLLENLARSGCYVYAYVEPTTRGDEKQNQRLIKELEKSGIHVRHSCNGLKVHMKAWLIIYEDNSLLSMISTGNFNVDTMKSYTDLHFISQDEKINMELLYLFKILFSGGNFKDEYDWWNDRSRNIFITPIAARHELTEQLEDINDRYSKNRVFVKCNNFTDNTLMTDLMKTWKCGADVRMMIRTSSIVPPNKTIEIRSKVSKYLEHSRLYIFGDNVFISSADMMKRNMKRRLEILLKIPSEYTDVHTMIRYIPGVGIEFASIPMNAYVGKLWESCNYEIDTLSARWKYRRHSK